MKKTIILEHRQALDEMEAARGKYRTCRHNKKCDGGNDCIACPATLDYQAKKAVFDEKVAALNKLNEQAIERQRNKVLMKINKRTKEGAEISMKETKSPLYKREDLTVERYKKHRETDKLSNREIGEMYGFPASSFEKWKRDNNLTNPRSAKAVPEQTESNREEPTYKQQYEVLTEEHLKLQRELDAVKAESAEKLQEVTSLKTELQRLEEVNIGLKTERDIFEVESNHYKQQIASQTETIERLQADIATLIEDADNDTIEAIQRQFQRFDQWETMMLERLLQMKKAN